MKIVSLNHTFPLFKYKTITRIWWMPKSAFNFRFEKNFLNSKHFTKTYRMFLCDAENNIFHMPAFMVWINVQIENDIRKFIGDHI